MKYSVIIFIIVGLFIAGSGEKKSGQSDNNGKKKRQQEISYKKDIVPIFKKYCLPCHTEDEMNPSQLYLESYSELMDGGKHGPPIVPGRSDTSMLLKKISSTPPFGDPMPYKFKRQFPVDTLTMLGKWIDQGAKNN